MGATTNELTLKQAKFVDAYIETNGNGALSAAIAGYSTKSNGSLRATASENLTKANVANAIQNKLRSVMQSDEVLETFTSYARHKPKEIKASDSLKALEMLAKVHKLVDDSPKNIEVNINVLTHLNAQIQLQIDARRGNPDAYTDKIDRAAVIEMAQEYCKLGGQEYDESALTCLALLEEET